MVNFRETGSASQGSGRLQHLARMAVDLHMTPDAGDAAVGVNQNRCSNNPLEGPAIHGFFAPDAVCLDGLKVPIGAQWNAQRVLVAEFGLGADVVARNPQNGGPSLLELLQVAREVDRLKRAAGCVCTRI